MTIMKHIACIVLTAIAAAAVAPAMAADVGVSVSVSQPGFFGEIHIGDLPQPPVIYTRPVIIRREARYVPAPAVYLHVPPGHAKNWSKHCARYDACGRPVYFVRDDWYEKVYVPHVRDAREDDREHGRHGEGHGRKGD